MSDPGTPPEEPLIDAEGTDPDMPSTDDEPRGDSEHDDPDHDGKDFFLSDLP
ncbi:MULTISPECIES: hypothetical protein [unclassified Microbacterium]|uniref:hypothetical protein n=1 Tax=unclassified Microbacterium TaxID=2609290 RepID=UPI003015F975